jgi:hypothetical protein
MTFVSDAARSRLRETMAKMEREIARLPKQTASGDGDSTTELVAIYADLAKQLALGPEPEVRECPVCKRNCMRAATRCGYCWAILVPPVDGGESAVT